ncbi:hypothetical protein N7533_010665 [Penicillium manginii]|uniref:uncharacterized protein n=1 Tax=Penicillium manginii TaxID=203109 RepID=UPI0025486287|nr:uncharacterized protein N7533_010665 [Penicillium manginii]KAJ5741256.1 hypothetical protein N7533_010665 [Penicillium manginii]
MAHNIAFSQAAQAFTFELDDALQTFSHERLRQVVRYMCMTSSRQREIFKTWLFVTEDKVPRPVTSTFEEHSSN